MIDGYTATANDLQRIRKIAEAEGFCLIKGVFAPEEMTRLLEGMKSLSAASANGTHHDVLSWTPLRWLLFDPRILAIAPTLIGQQLVYYSQSTVSYEETIGRLTLQPYNDLHCDAFGMPDDLFAPWQNPAEDIFRGYRFGIYFRDYSRGSGGLKVAAKSHLGDCTRFRPRNIFVKPAAIRNVGDARISVYETHTPVVNIPSEPGDLVIWNLRTFHAAGARLFSADPAQAVHPLMENILNDTSPELFAPVVGPRNALFFDYGAPVEEVDLYIKHRAVRLDQSAIQALMTATTDSDAACAAADVNGVQLRHDGVIYALAAKLLFIHERIDAELAGQASGGTDVKWLRAKADALAARLSALLAAHREFSPYFALFSRKDHESSATGDIADSMHGVARDIVRRVASAWPVKERAEPARAG